MIVVSCSGRFHAFALAEQLEKHQMLQAFYTSYAYQKNKAMRRFAKRVDKEAIPVGKLHTAIEVAVMMRMGRSAHSCNAYFDKWVARKIKSNQENYRAFIGWSGMSLHALRQAKQDGKLVVLERGSSHILYQNEVLKEEYKRFGIDFSIDPRTIEKELQEYEEADYIAIPSIFVKNSFLEYGIDPAKLVQNPYGSSSHFKKTAPVEAAPVFRILYMGSLLIRKGLVYLFEALDILRKKGVKFEAWFIGKVDEELKATVEQYNRPEYQFFGHINFYDLPRYINACDVAVQPSLEEGLSMVVPQLIACGVPVVASTNSGGEDVIEEGETGYVVPIKNPQAIAEKLQHLYENPDLLAQMKRQAANSPKTEFSWDSYGQRYAGFLKTALAGNFTKA